MPIPQNASRFVKIGKKIGKSGLTSAAEVAFTTANAALKHQPNAGYDERPALPIWGLRPSFVPGAGAGQGVAARFRLHSASSASCC